MTFGRGGGIPASWVNSTSEATLVGHLNASMKSNATSAGGGVARAGPRGGDGPKGMYEVVNWVTLTERNNDKKRRSGRGVEDGELADHVYALRRIEDKTLTVPVGNRMYPHSGHISEGVVTVKATSHLSIVVPQRPWRPPTTSTKSQQAVFGRVAEKAPSPRRTAVAADTDLNSIKLELPAAMKVSSKRDRRILSRLVSGQIDCVDALPMPALFEMKTDTV